MKKAALFTCLLAISAACFAQQQTDQVPKTTEELQKLSTKQKKTANALLLSGSIAAISGPLLVYAADREALLPVGAFLLVAGLGAMVASIPFYVASGKNKRKANEISVGTGWQMIDEPIVRAQYSNGFPVLKVSVRL